MAPWCCQKRCWTLSTRESHHIQMVRSHCVFAGRGSSVWNAIGSQLSVWLALDHIFQASCTKDPDTCIGNVHGIGGGLQGTPLRSLRSGKQESATQHACSATAAAFLDTLDADMRAAAEPLLPYLAATAGTSRGRNSDQECSHDVDGASPGAYRHDFTSAQLPNHLILQNTTKQDLRLQSTLDLARAALALSTGVGHEVGLPQTLDVAAMQLAGSCALARAAQAPGGLAAVTYLDLHACGLRDTQASTKSLGTEGVGDCTNGSTGVQVVSRCVLEL